MSRFTNDDYTYLGQLLQSIDARNWKGLEHLLRTQPRKFVSVSKLVAQSDQLNGMTILHACMRFDPPPRIVQIVILLSPRSPGSMDCLNRTPLHIAAGVRAKPESIAILLEACRKAASIQDADGKTPLHLACDNNCELFEGDEDVERPPTSLAVIQCLALAALEAVPLEDTSGTSSLEYAILSDAAIETVKFLMSTTQMQIMPKNDFQRKNEPNPKADGSLGSTNAYLTSRQRNGDKYTGNRRREFHPMQMKNNEPHVIPDYTDSDQELVRIQDRERSVCTV